MPPKRSLRSRLCPLLSCVLTALISPDTFAAKKAGKDSVPETTGSLLQLSPFEVTAHNLKFEHWIKISSPHFVIYTDTSTKEATILLQHMEMVHQATQFFLHRKSLKLAPMLLVLPTGRSDWGKIKSVGGVEWTVATSLVGSSRDLLLVQYDWQSDGLESVWAMIGLKETLSVNLNGPLWFKRGLADFFATVTFGKDSLNIGKESYSSYYLKKYGWMNWAKFFSITSASPEFTNDTNEHHQYEGQSSVFVHHLLTNSDPASVPRLLGWAAYLDAGNPPTEESFKELFHHDWQGWQAQIDKMLNGGNYTSGNIRFPPAALNFEIVSGNPSSVEMRELFVLSQILNQNTKNSETSLDALLDRGLKTDSLRELFADACNRRDRNDAAVAEYRKVISGGTSNPEVYAEAAKLLFRKALPKQSLESQFDDETGEIRLWCNKALEIEPLDVSANETLAWTEAYAPTVKKSNLDTIIRICRTLDQNAPTDEALTALAVARWRSGGLKQSRSLCERLIASPFTRKSMKAMATELLSRIDATPSPSGAESTPKVD